MAVLMQLGPLGSLGQASDPKDGLDGLNETLSGIFEESDLPGLAMIVVNDSGVLLQNALGFADMGAQQPYTDRTVQNIGSISKTFIAAAVMRAEELGKLDLDDPINDYLPFQVVHPRFPNTPITIRHLTQHTSGISDRGSYSKAYVLNNPETEYPELPKDVQKYISQMSRNEDMPTAEFLRNVLSQNGKWYTKRNFTKKAPGRQYHYSNIAAALAAYVVEEATGTDFFEFTGQHIFQPLQMNTTSWALTDANRDLFAKRYLPDDILVPDYHLITTADGGLLTNTTDFGKYLMEMLNGAKGNGTILSRESYAEMFTRVSFGKESSGVFWGINENGVLNHSGGDPGIVSLCAINPKRNVAAFIMTNVSADEDKELLKSLIRVWKALKEHQWN
ncbi:MAG: serine hydrolase domain-containing protein [Flavobacteriaceae bacterium]